jgi:hypothetical protein
MIFLLLSKSSFSLNKSSTLFGIYTPGTFFNPLTPPAVEALCMFRFNAKLIDRASDLINEDKLDETQAGLITLASKAALEIHKQIGKNIQSASTAGGVNGLKKVPGV